MEEMIGTDFLKIFVDHKSPFWEFPQGIVQNQEDFEEFIAQITSYHELVEVFRCSNDENLMRFNPHRMINSLLYCDILKTLALTHSNLDDAGASAMTRFMKLSPTCTSIDLSGNNFSPDGISKICTGLWGNTMIVTFAFGHNKVDDTSIDHFKDMLTKNKMLENLDLSHNTFTANGENTLFIGLRHNTSLRKLEYKHITNKKQEVAEKLRQNQLNWRQKFIADLDKEETGKWNRSKLMFIGQGRAGKTSTVNRLLHKGFDDKQDSTVGASVSQTQSSTTAEQKWKQVKEDDPEYLGKGMAGEQAGRLIAARKLVNKEDKERKKNLAEMKKKGLAAERKLAEKRERRDIRENRVAELSPEALRMLQEQAKKDQLERDRILAEDLQRREMANANQFDPDLEELRRIEAEEELRKQKEKEVDEDTARMYAEAVFKAAREGKDSITFSLWDYGGQSVFYALHHLFLTKYGVYVLCVDMTEILTKPDVAKEYLLFWLNSVRLHAPTAPVLLVGTHMDALEKIPEELNEVNEFIEANFSEKFKQIVSMHPRYAYYPVDNKNNKGVNELRFDIERISRNQEFVTADVSVRWMFCLDKIMVGRDTGGKTPAWMKLSEVRTYAGLVKMESHEEVERMLTLFHELGVLVRLKGTEELRNLITLDPQWLLDGLCMVIRDEHLHGPSKSELEKVGLVQEMDLLYKKGLASLDVMKYLWSDDKFREHFNYLLDLMKYMVLISDWDFRDEKMFVIPSLLIKRPEEDLFEEEKQKEKAQNEASAVQKRPAKGKKKSESGKDGEQEEEKERHTEKLTDYVQFDFSKLFLPMGVFQRLVCMCVAYSTSLGTSVGKVKKVTEPELYKTWAKIWMGNDTILFLEQRDDEIWLSVQDPSTAPTCFNAVYAMLQKLNADLMGAGLKWDVNMVKEKKITVQKKGEHPKITRVRETEVKEADARVKHLQPWYEPKRKSADVAAAKLPELIDLDNFVNSL